MSEQNHTQAELLEMCAKMEAVSAVFYGLAVGVGNHAFIEFTGLMNEYINVCRGMAERGEDFTEHNTHANKPLPLETYQRNYIREKLDCIFMGQVDLKEK